MAKDQLSQRDRARMEAMAAGGLIEYAPCAEPYRREDGETFLCGRRPGHAGPHGMIDEAEERRLMDAREKAAGG